jgi:hypothetical protein
VSALFWETITLEMRSILGGFGESEVGTKFYLAGGTALALQLGHHLSVDLYFFLPDRRYPPLRPTLEKALALFSPILAVSAWGNLAYLARNVRLGFYGYGYEMVAPLVETQEVRLASVEDIALMKLDALLARRPEGFLRSVFHLPEDPSPNHPRPGAPKLPLRAGFRNPDCQTPCLFRKRRSRSRPETPCLCELAAGQRLFPLNIQKIAGDWLA